MKKLALLLTAVATILSGCVALPTRNQNISAAQNLNTVQMTAASQARKVCAEYGAAPGTRMFFNCMKQQTAAAEYQVALANCRSESYSWTDKRECLRGGSGIIGLGSCLTQREQECEANARLAYLPDANANNYNISSHQYTHIYEHDSPGGGGN